MMGIIAAAALVFFLTNEQALAPDTKIEEGTTAGAVTYFRSQMVDQAVADIGQPIEGFDANMLIKAYPGLVAADFAGVAGVGGYYQVMNGKVTFARDSTQPVSSAEGAVTETGYSTLLENLAARFTLTAPDAAAIDKLIKRINTGERATAALGGTAAALGISVTPTTLREDSRCPVDVTCIQAGTVRVDATIEVQQGVVEDVVLTLNESTVMPNGATVTLVGVNPVPVATATPEAADYQFTFSIVRP